MLLLESVKHDVAYPYGQLQRASGIASKRTFGKVLQDCRGHEFIEKREKFYFITSRGIDKRKELPKVVFQHWLERRMPFDLEIEIPSRNDREYGPIPTRKGLEDLRDIVQPLTESPIVGEKAGEFLQDVNSLLALLKNVREE